MLVGTLLLGLVGAGCDSDSKSSSKSSSKSAKDQSGAEVREGELDANQSELMERAQSLAGRYAHFDAVAYESEDMKTLIISYGFTDLTVRGDELIARETFCHADHRTDQPIETTISDVATAAIRPVPIAVVVSERDGDLWLYRPETPTGIGIDLEDPANDVLPTDPNDPRIADDDNDGNPGVTVHIKVSEELQGDLYIARRERFAYNVKAEGDTLTGTVDDVSEQLLIGASNPIFITTKPWVQVEDRSKSPIVLKRVEDERDCDWLNANRDVLFPNPPVVDW